MKRCQTAIAVCCLFAVALAGFAAWSGADPEAKKTAKAAPMTVALLGFEASKGLPEDLGAKVGALVFTRLSSKPGIRLVEREKLARALEEMELGLAGMAKPAEAVKVGHLLAAQVLVTGRAFSVDKDLIIVTKIIGTETGRVFAEAVKVASEEKLSDATQQLADKIAANIGRNARWFKASIPAEKDRIARIKKAIAKQKLPRVLVTVSEQHLGRPTIDPAAEIELCYYLNRCGFKIVEKEPKALTRWTPEYLKKPETPLPVELVGKVDVIIVGEAVSQFAMRKGNLVSSKARVEIKVIDSRTRQLLAVDRDTSAAVDLTETIAAKTAVQEATAEIALRIIPEFVKKWNRAHK